jgi:gentisate 1,2-dioxygenase
MTSPRLVDVSGRPVDAEPDFWEPVIVRAAEIDDEIERLCAAPAPPDGRRSALVVHPKAPADIPSLNPGVRVSIDVLLPGERTRPVRHNSTMVGFCIRGSGVAHIGDDVIPFGRYDAWNHPSWRTYWFENDGDEPVARLTYSNAPVLERLNVHLVEDDPGGETARRTGTEGRSDHAAGGGANGAGPDRSGDVDEHDSRRTSPYGTFPIGERGAHLMPYEILIDPPSLPSPALHWPWETVKEHLDRLEALGDSYIGRRLYLLYNPLTGRTNGTTPSFFATITIRPPSIVDRPHRHVSAAINYFFNGSGWSRVGGQRYEWGHGDLMLTAPGWMVHHHASDDGDRVYELTIQDQPFHIANESLLWQEDLARPARVLGSQGGFATNRPVGST